MPKYTASRLAKGNHLFPASINIMENGVKIRIPGFWRNEEVFFEFSDITGVSLNTPSWFSVLTYSTIRFNARGTWIEVEGFTKQDAYQIKRQIEQGSSNRSYGEPSYNNNRSRIRQEDIERVERFREEERERKNKRQKDKAGEILPKVKETLSTVIATLYLVKSKNNKFSSEDISEAQIKVDEVKNSLYEILQLLGREHHYEQIIEECESFAIEKNKKTYEDIFVEIIQEQKKNHKINPLFEEAARLVVTYQIASVSFLQRKLKLGYSTASDLLDLLEFYDVIGAEKENNERDILISTSSELDKLLEKLPRG